jgi:hypothetical protein
VVRAEALRRRRRSPDDGVWQGNAWWRRSRTCSPRTDPASGRFRHPALVPPTPARRRPRRYVVAAHRAGRRRRRVGIGARFASTPPGWAGAQPALCARQIEGGIMQVGLAVMEEMSSTGRSEERLVHRLPAPTPRRSRGRGDPDGSRDHWARARVWANPTISSTAAVVARSAMPPDAAEPGASAAAGHRLEVTSLPSQSPAERDWPVVRRVVVIGAGSPGAGYEPPRGDVTPLEQNQLRVPLHRRSAALFTECGGSQVRRLAIASRTSPRRHRPGSISPCYPAVMFVATHDQVAALEPRSPTIGRWAHGAVRLCARSRPVPGARRRRSLGIIEPHAHDIDVHALHTAYLRVRGAAGASSPPPGSPPRSQGQSGPCRPRRAPTTTTWWNAAGAWRPCCPGWPVGLVPKRRTTFAHHRSGPYPWPMENRRGRAVLFRPEESTCSVRPA